MCTPRLCPVGQASPIARKQANHVPWRNREILLLRVRVRPHQIRNGAVGRNLTEAVEDLYLVDRVDGRGEPAVHAKDAVVDHDRERQEVEHVREVGPYMRRTILPHAFRIKTIRLWKQV